MQMDARGMAKLIVNFRNFVNTPKKDTRNEELYTIWGCQQGITFIGDYRGIQ